MVQIRTLFRLILMVGLALLTVAGVLVFSPSNLELPKTPSSVTPSELIPGGGSTKKTEPLAPGIPKAVPEYSVDKFDYVSIKDEKKQWRLLADQAFLFNTAKIVHTRTITAHLYDSSGKITVVTGLEAKYLMDDRDLEVFGNVVTTLPDGFEVRSEYLKYDARAQQVKIPTSHRVTGQGAEQKGQRLSFVSQGLQAVKTRILLPQGSVVTLTRHQTGRKLSERTTVESDQCVLKKDKQVAEFTMFQSRPVDRRFIRITQPNLVARSRQGELRYGEPAAEKKPASAARQSPRVEYLVLKEDVLIKETRTAEGTPQLRYATGGEARFDSLEDKITLRQFPQVYQDNDTVTGEVIVVHRDTDIVEVKDSNAFSEGKLNEQQ